MLTPPADTLEWLKFGWAVVQSLLTGAIALHLWLVNRQRVRREALEALEARVLARIDKLDADAERRLDDHHNRITAVEHATAGIGDCRAHGTELARMKQAMENMPTNQMVRDGDSRAHERIDRVTTQMSEMAGALRRIERNLDMLSEHLLNKERG